MFKERLSQVGTKLLVKTAVAAQRMKDDTSPEEFAKMSAAFTAALAVAMVADNLLVGMASGTGGPIAIPRGSGTNDNINPFEVSQKLVCDVSAFLRGPIAIGIIICMICWAGYKIITGQRGGTGAVVVALAGAFVVFGAPSLASFAVGSDGGCGI